MLLFVNDPVTLDREREREIEGQMQQKVQIKSVRWNLIIKSSSSPTFDYYL